VFRLDRSIARLGITAAIVFTLLLLPWPGLGAPFTRAFSEGASWLIDHLRASTSLTIDFRCAVDVGERPVLQNAPWQMLLLIRDPTSGWADWLYAVDLRKLAYVPLALFVALTVGAPIRRTRAWVGSVFLGFALIGVLVTVSVAMPIVNVLGRVHLIAASRELLWVTRALGWMFASAGSASVLVLWALSKWLVPENQ
jgi:hypothetical protein